MVQTGEINLMNLDEEVNSEIRTHFRPIANDIAQKAEQGDMVLVTGRKQIGKTQTLIPEIQAKLKSDGYKVISIDAQSYQKTDEIFNILPPSNDGKNVVILDEAGLFSFAPNMQSLDNEKIVTFQRGLQEKGYHLIAVFTHQAGHKNDVLDPVKQWQDISQGLKRQLSPLIDLDLKSILPESIAIRYLTSLMSPGKQAAFLQSPLPKMILSLAPSDLGVLTYFRNCGTKEKIRDAIIRSYSNLFGDDYLNQKEKQNLRERFKEEFGENLD